MTDEHDPDQRRDSNDAEDDYAFAAGYLRHATGLLAIFVLILVLGPAVSVPGALPTGTIERQPLVLIAGLVVWCALVVITFTWAIRRGHRWWPWP